MWRFNRDKPDGPNSFYLHGNFRRDADSDSDAHADSDSGNHADAATCAARLDYLHGYHAELDHRPAVESAARCDIADAWKSDPAAPAGFTAGCGTPSGNRDVDDYHCHTCRDAVATDAA
jgi:hypothetical protein